MATPTIPNGETQFFPILYEGNGGGQRVGKFVPFTDNGTIANSVIFNDDDNAYLSRTNDAGDRDTFTISVWVKRGNLGSVQHIFDTYDGSSSNDGYIRFNADNTISIRLGSPSNMLYTTNRTFEDTSKFYHIMLSVNTNDSTAGDRAKLYIDGDRITSFSTQTNAGSSDDTQFNYSSATFRIGSTTGGSYDLDGYLAEFNQVDGTALTPSTFGITDTSTGRWIPKTLSGITYGTNGFRLTFADSSAFGDDLSGNTNDFTATNLASTDQTTDSPTQLFTILSSNQTAGSPTLSEGNLGLTAPSSNYGKANGSLGFEANTSTGLYWEVLGSSSIVALETGIIIESQGAPQTSGGQVGAYYIYNRGAAGGNTWWVQFNDDQQADTGISWANNDKVGLAIKNGNLWFAINNTWVLSGNPATGANPVFTGLTGKYRVFVAEYNSASVTLNSGSKSFTYTAPTGFVSLQQDNMPTTAKGVSGLVWVKNRDSASFNHVLYDSSRGVHNYINSNTTGAQGTDSDGLTKFLKGGFATEDAGYTNTSGNSFVGWNWVGNSGSTSSNSNGSVTSTVQANQTAGFSIVQYTGTGSAATVGHGLSSTPEWIFGRPVEQTGGYNWSVYHKSMTSASYYLELNTSDAEASDSNVWGSAPTSSVVNIGSGTSASSEPYILYCWHGVDGFSKFGKYVGNGNADGTFIYTGFKPAFVMVKGATNTGSWVIMDSKRDPFNAGSELYLLANSSDAEAGSIAFDFLSNGFKCRDNASGLNASGVTYIYMAFAEHPFIGDGTSPVTAR
jgi:hypothetical protein